MPPRVLPAETAVSPCLGALEVLFSQDDLDVARMIARLRHRSARRLGRRPRFESLGETPAERDTTMRSNAETGCLGEFAVSVLTGRRWVFNVGGCGGIDVEPFFEVKTRTVWDRRDLNKVFRFQVWRKDVDDVLVGVLRLVWPGAVPEGWAARVLICGWLPLTPDLYHNGAHQMIPGRDLLPATGLVDHLEKETGR